MEPVKIEWVKGEPPEAMWCWATYMNNNDPPEPGVDFLWFNPAARGNWWHGEPGLIKNFDLKVTHWMKMPVLVELKTTPKTGPAAQIRILKIDGEHIAYIKPSGKKARWVKPEDAFNLVGDFDIRFEVKTYEPAKR
jgi:hypothetical protein